MAESESLKAKTWKELFEMVKHNSLLAKVKRGEEQKKDHEACESAIFEIIQRKYGHVSLTFGEIAMQCRKNIGCEACMDAFEYAQAMLECRDGKIKEIQEQYCTNIKGCAVVKDGLVYIDPEARMPG